MAGSFKQNTAGTANTNNYVLGRGILYAAELTSGGLIDDKGWRDLGNATTLTFNRERETLEHQSSRSGIRRTDKEIEVSSSTGFSFTLDEISAENVALFFGGDIVSVANPAASAETGPNKIAEAVTLGRSYDITDGDGNRAYGFTDTSDVTVSTTDGGTALTEGTDYTLDRKLGTIFVIEGGGVSAGDDLFVTWSADSSIPDLTEIRGALNSTKTIALKFKSINPADNDNVAELEIHKASISAEGDFGLISDEYTTMNFTGTMETNADKSPNSPTFTIRTVDDNASV